jgi:hypothetical protein
VKPVSIHPPHPRQGATPPSPFAIPTEANRVPHTNADPLAKEQN